MKLFSGSDDYVSLTDVLGPDGYSRYYDFITGTNEYKKVEADLTTALDAIDQLLAVIAGDTNFSDHSAKALFTRKCYKRKYDAKEKENKVVADKEYWEQEKKNLKLVDAMIKIQKDKDGV